MNTTRSRKGSAGSNRAPQSETASTSSDRVTFPKGGKRDDVARDINYGLFCPSAMRALARTFKEGELKYGARNWEKGIPTENYIDHALQHIFNAMSGGDFELIGDPITELSHALWNIAAAIHNETGCVHHVWED